MKTSVPSFFVFILFVSSISHSLAQSAQTNQIGLRIGGFSGVTFRHIGSNNMGIQIDLMENFHGDWTMLSVMGEKHIPLGQQFVFDIGGGAFVGGFYDNYYDHGEDHYWDPAIGLEGVVGFDYYFQKVPLDLGIDLTPRFSFVNGPFPWDAGIALRYIF